MARKMNYDAAKRREWKAEARHQKAMEISNDQMIRIRVREEFLARPATEAQYRLVVKYEMHKHCGHDDAYLEIMTIRAADALIKKYGADNNWKKSPKKQPYQKKRKDYKKQPEYKPLKTLFETQGKPNMDGANIIRSKGPERK